MLIADLIEDLNKYSENELIFILTDINGKYLNLQLNIDNSGRYIHPTVNREGTTSDIIAIILEKQDNAKA